jgi:hypothetical protein
MMQGSNVQESSIWAPMNSFELVVRLKQRTVPLREPENYVTLI